MKRNKILKNEADSPFKPSFVGYYALTTFYYMMPGGTNNANPDHKGAKVKLVSKDKQAKSRDSDIIIDYLLTE
ncbi:hypothetical protein QQ020_35725 [Fulvivirgaceae bacterium BMA12]|uniref:Uncharacterized protein n=1 Tax=Agaribacillus aureus TaxID=3051825 RepID=A0ABT8LI83_9BACT|nr:hypothetical protein [Fulvivirgaceae bacterium BMA12]